MSMQRCKNRASSALLICPLPVVCGIHIPGMNRVMPRREKLDPLTALINPSSGSLLLTPAYPLLHADSTDR